MKSKIIIIIFTTLSMAKSVCAQQGYLKVICPIPGLKVMLDTMLVGVTPLNVVRLNTGSYQISLINPEKKNWQNEDWADAIVISNQDTTIVKPIFSKNLILRSKPFDAEVFLDKEYIGNTPLYIKIQPPINGEILFRKKNYVPYSLKINELTQTPIDINLEQSINVPSLEPYIEKEKRAGRIKRLSYSMMALSIGSGIASVYFKDEANKKYNQYLVAGNINSMNRLFDDSKKYDKYSAVSFTLFEVTYLLSFYFLIKTFED